MEMIKEKFFFLLMQVIGEKDSRDSDDAFRIFAAKLGTSDINLSIRAEGG